MKVTSEVGILNKVLIHHPDDGIDLLSPSNMEDLLYDDVIHLPLMQEEHLIFEDILSILIGEGNVLETQNLLEEVLEEFPNAKSRLLQYIAQQENCKEEDLAKLASLNAEDLTYTLFTGILEQEDRSIFDPLPNYVFTRDIGVVVNDHIIICNAAKDARTRESILTRCIIYYHPFFKTFQANNYEKIIDLTKEEDQVTVEGGDVMIYENDYLLIGHSERTSQEAINHLKDILFKKGVVKHVVQIDIPKQRSSMHIDTVFTQISKNDFVVYEAMMQSKQVKITDHQSDQRQTEFSTLMDFFKSVNKDCRFIPSGGGKSPYDEKEQWTDGCNLVALKDGVAIAYDRNTKTNDALEHAGYEVIEWDEFIEEFGEEENIINKFEKTIITISSAELSRARGGPHCMTFPISRG